MLGSYTPASLLSHYHDLACAAAFPGQPPPADPLAAPPPASFYTSTSNFPSPADLPSTPIYVLRFLLYKHLSNPQPSPLSLRALCELLSLLYLHTMKAAAAESVRQHFSSLNPVGEAVADPHALLRSLPEPAGIDLVPPYVPEHVSTDPAPVRFVLNVFSHLYTSSPLSSLYNLFRNTQSLPPPTALDATDVLVLPFHHIRSANLLFSPNSATFLKIPRPGGTGYIDAVRVRPPGGSGSRAAVYSNPNAGVYELCFPAVGCPPCEALFQAGREGVAAQLAEDARSSMNFYAGAGYDFVAYNYGTYGRSFLQVGGSGRASEANAKANRL